MIIQSLIKLHWINLWCLLWPKIHKTIRLWLLNFLVNTNSLLNMDLLILLSLTSQRSWKQSSSNSKFFSSNSSSSSKSMLILTTLALTMSKAFTYICKAISCSQVEWVKTKGLNCQEWTKSTRFLTPVLKLRTMLTAINQAL